MLLAGPPVLMAYKPANTPKTVLLRFQQRTTEIREGVSIDYSLWIAIMAKNVRRRQFYSNSDFKLIFLKHPYARLATMKVSVIIPALNEAGNIGAVISDLDPNIVDECIVIDGGSTDETVSIAQSLGAARYTPTSTRKTTAPTRPRIILHRMASPLTVCYERSLLQPKTGLLVRGSPAGLAPTTS